MLDDLMELLDTPRQALTNLARSAFGDVDPLAGLPGGLGLIGALGLGATGIGLPLALLGGSAIGGLAQSGGNASGNEAFRAPTTGEVGQGLFGSDDFLSSLLAGALTDPLTYAGGIGGGRVGAKLGREAEIATHAAGPGYRGKNSLLEAIQAGDKATEAVGWDRHFSNRFDQMAPGQFDRIASEVPPGSSFLGSGSDAIAMRTPQGDVLRIGNIPDARVGQGRPVAESVLPSTRSVDVPVSGMEVPGFRVERSPLAEMKPAGYWKTPPAGPGMTARQKRMLTSPVEELENRASREGISFWDQHVGNVGVHGDKPVIIDPGAFSLEDFKGQYAPVTVSDSAEAGILPRLLGQPRLRSAIEQGRPTDNLGLERLLSRLGAGLGTGSVVTERAF